MGTFSNLPIIGPVALQSQIEVAADIIARGGQPQIAPLTTSLGNNLKVVFGRAGAALSSGLAVCAIDANGVVTASGGSYVAPTRTGGMAIGDCGWFTQASAA